jgi:hypothetical protein
VFVFELALVLGLVRLLFDTLVVFVAELLVEIEFLAGFVKLRLFTEGLTFPTAFTSEFNLVALLNFPAKVLFIFPIFWLVGVFIGGRLLPP